MRRLAVLTLLIAAAAHAQKIDAIHRIDTVDEDGMQGTHEEWSTSALERRERVDHVHDQTTIVYDGKSGWKRDWNGFVEKLAGSDLRRQADLAFLHTMLGVTGTEPREFHPQGGDIVRVEFDPATSLPARAEMPSFDGVATVAFSDWRDVNGTKVPFTETWTTGPNTSTVKLQSIEFVPRDRIDLTPPQPGPEDTFFLRERKSETIPFNFDNNHIFILGTVNGTAPLWYLVDTGANFTVLNQSRVATMNVATYGGLTTIGGGSAATSGSYAEHVTYRFGDAELRDQHAAVLELRGLEKIYGMAVGGILGFDFLSRFATDIDYVHKTLTLHPRTFDTSRMSGTTIPLTIQGEQPYFAGSIRAGDETIPAWFILDVGAADTLTLTTPFIAKHNLVERAGEKERIVRKFSAPDIEAFNPTNIRGLVDAVTMGDITLPHVLVNLSAAKSGAYTSPAFDGNIGETILSRFAHVILDYRRSVMILQPQPSTTKPFEERKTFGMSVIAGSPDLHHFTVTAVGDQSPAAAAGFRKGDVIASVDGTPAAQMTLADLKRLLAESGSQHEFVVTRGKENFTLDAKIATMPLSTLR